MESVSNKLPAFDPDSIDFEPANVLIVDDIAHNRQLIKEFFAKTKIITTEAKNGQVAVDLVYKHKFDLVLMDIKMPVMNGYQATSLIKEFNLNLPVVALTASTMETSENYNKNTFDEYLRKPINKAVLTEKLAQFLKHKRISKPVKIIEQRDLSNIINPDKLLELINSKVLDSWKQAKDSHNLNDFQNFNKQLLEINQLQSSSEITQLIELLQDQIETFNIGGLLTSLNDFEEFVQLLKGV
jgi:CheY-like chemotaxis protein